MARLPYLSDFLLRRGLLLLALIGLGLCLYQNQPKLTLTPQPKSEIEQAGSVIGGDFRLFYTQARLAAGTMPAKVYDSQSIATAPLVKDLPIKANPSFYPPHFFLLIEPIAKLDFATSWWLYQTGTLLALAITLWIAFRRLEMVLLGLGFGTFWTGLSFGQTTPVLVPFYLLALAALTRFPFISGAALAVASCKPHLGLALPLQLIWRQHRAVIISGVLALAGLLFAAYHLYGIELFLAWQNSLLAPWQRLTGSAYISGDAMASFYAASRSLGLALYPALAVQAVAALYALVRLYQICDHAQSPRSAFAAAVIASLMITPHLYVYDLALLLLPFLVVIERCKVLGWPSFALALLPAFYLACGFIMALSQHMALPLAPLLLIFLHETLWRTERQTYVPH
jgi:hypothetical protein